MSGWPGPLVLLALLLGLAVLIGVTTDKPQDDCRYQTQRVDLDGGVVKAVPCEVGK